MLPGSLLPPFLEERAWDRGPPLVNMTLPMPITPISQTEANDSFCVVFLSNRVKKCYGCTQEFARKANGTLLDPPHDFVVRHADHREYYSSGAKKVTKQKQNTYFLGPERMYQHSNVRSNPERSKRQNLCSNLFLINAHPTCYLKLAARWRRLRLLCWWRSR